MREPTRFRQQRRSTTNSDREKRSVRGILFTETVDVDSPPTPEPSCRVTYMFTRRPGVGEGLPSTLYLVFERNEFIGNPPTVRNPSNSLHSPVLFSE